MFKNYSKLFELFSIDSRPSLFSRISSSDIPLFFLRHCYSFHSASVVVTASDITLSPNVRYNYHQP